MKGKVQEVKDPFFWLLVALLIGEVFLVCAFVRAGVMVGVEASSVGFGLLW